MTLQGANSTPDDETNRLDQATDVETGVETLSLQVSEESVKLIKTFPEMVRDGDGEPIKTTSSESIQMDIEERLINQYTDFVAEHEGFQSTASSKSDTERIALVEVSDSGEITWHDPRVGVDWDSVKHLRDDSVWNHELTTLPGVKVKKTGSNNDRHRSHTKRKVRVGRDAVEEIDGRLLVLKWRDANGSSRGDSGWSKFQPITAAEILVEDS